MLVLGLAGLAADLAWRSRGWPLIHDVPIMHYIAWRIGEGAVPYRDLFDMNFPGVYLLHRAVLGLGGPGDLAWRVFDLAWLAATGLALAAFAVPWGGVAAAGGALLFALYHLAGGAWQAGQRDFLLGLFLLGGALGVTRWVEGHGRSRRPLLAGGLALGMGITIKPHAAAYAALLGALVAVGAWRAGRGPLGPIAFYGAAVVLPLLGVAAWVAALGGLPAWRVIVLDYLVPLYARLGRPAQWGFYQWQVWVPLGASVVMGLGAAVGGRRFTTRHVVALLGLAYGVAHYVGQGKGWEYHTYPAAVFAAALAAAEVGRARRWLTALPLAVTVAVAGLMLHARGVEAASAGWIGAKQARVQALVGDLGVRLRPGDRVQVLDTTGGGLHALLCLGVLQPTRFLYDFHFFHDVDTPVVRALRAELIRGLAARPPRFIVLFREGWPAGGLERVAAFPELATLLGTIYRVERRGDGYLLYAKRDGP